MEIAALASGVIVCVHLLCRFAGYLRRDNYYNRSIRFLGGKEVGEYQGEAILLYSAENPTLPAQQPRERVTSSFSSVRIQLLREETGEVFEAWMEDKLLVGRAPAAGCGICLDDSLVSREHCMLYRRGEQMMLQDLHSTNHTYVNGFLAEGAVSLSSGDRLKLGNGLYRFQCFYQEDV